MIKSITPVISTLLLLGGSFLVLAIPTWMTYVLLASTAIMLATHLAYKHSNMMSLLWSFCVGFFGFCVLVILFVSTIVIMNGILTA
ncbi:hypothetical protein MNBD_GAMMA02-1169 [hydrothermal vent metagenome]|uniref:Uncharacterized protein n=1 Tax=hydrothermal vent metagenome TaxID=652676 RepID=A0A3B0WXI5_9ZZZZ